MTLSKEDLRLMRIKSVSQQEKRPVNFVAYVNETSNGCDYTIACGKTLWKLEAETQEDALKELKNEIISDDDGVHNLEEVTLYQVSSIIEVPLELWYKEREKEEEAHENARKEKNEQLEFKRLKAKYG